MNEPTARRHSGPAERNRGPLLAQLQRLLPAQGLALEIAAGTGQHAAHFAAGLPGWRWLPTDLESESLPSIAAWCEGLANVLPPLQLDILDTPWAGVPQAVDLIFNANMIHISPWATCAALMQGAARHLSPAGLLLTYGPYVEAGVETVDSNLAFDVWLKARDPGWGLRHLDDVAAQATAAGLHLRERVAMPANNLLLVWGRA